MISHFSAMVSLASMAMPADGNVTAVVKNEVSGIINFVPLIYYENSVTRNVFLRKKISEKKFTESE